MIDLDLHYKLVPDKYFEPSDHRTIDATPIFSFVNDVDCENTNG